MLSLAWPSAARLLDASAASPQASIPSIVGEQLGALSERGASIESETRSGDLADIAASVLETYRDSESCMLVSSGYLDLAGRVWQCMVARDGEVELCFVEETESMTCEIHVVRMGREIAEDLKGVL